MSRLDESTKQISVKSPSLMFKFKNLVIKRILNFLYCTTCRIINYLVRFYPVKAIAIVILLLMNLLGR
jgi:hypothetical protein